MPQDKNRFLPSSSFSDLRDSLDAAFDRLQLPSNNPTAFRRLAEEHVAHTVPSEDLSTIWLNLDDLNTQAVVAADRFLSMYGNKLWTLSNAAIQRDHDLRRNAEGYFVCLLQMPERWSRNKPLSDVLLPPQQRPRSFSIPRDFPEAKRQWTKLRKQKAEKMKRDDEVEKQMAKITIREVDSLDGEGEEDPKNDMDDIEVNGGEPKCGLLCTMLDCGKVLPDPAAMSDHYDREHP